MIDEKGRLFGKINIVDLLVLLVVVIGVVVVAVKFVLPNTPAGGGGSSKTHLTYQVLVENVRPEVYENVQKYIPSTLMAAGEMLDGQVVAVTAEPREQQVNMSTSGGTALVIPVNQGNLNLTFTIECNVVNPITSEIGTQEVRVGKNHIVKTDKIELGSGVIIDCEWGTDSETE